MSVLARLDEPAPIIDNIDDAAAIDQAAELDPEEERRRARSQRFQTEYKQRERPTGQPNSRQAKHDDFRTGFDMYNPEEKAKRESRAARFATSGAVGQEYTPIVDEEDARRRERAERFGTEFNAVDHSGLKEQDILEERKDQGAAVERRPEAVHLYGVDRMSTRECLQYFEEYGASQVEWLDDSSCNIVFNDADSAKRAMVGKGRPFGPGDVQELQGLDLHDINNLPYFWHKGEDFQKGKGKKAVALPLIFRMATVDDRKGLAPAKPSRHLWAKHVNGKSNGQTKRSRAQLDADGDFLMGQEPGQRGNRGGKSLRRKKRRGLDGGDVEMEDAEAIAEEPVVITTFSADEEASQKPDLRGMLSARQKESQSGQTRLFSAREAGVEVPPDKLEPETAQEPVMKEADVAAE